MERLALSLLNLGEYYVLTVASAFHLAGFVGALWVHRKSKAELYRAPYLFFLSVTGLFYALISIARVWTVPVVLSGFYWVPLTGYFFVSASVGYWIGQKTVARAVNAFGGARFAFLSMIPVANLVLLFRRSIRVSTMRINDRRISTGVTGVIFGLVFTLLSVLVSIRVGALANAQAMTDEGRRDEIAFAIKVRGLENTLLAAVQEINLPLPINEVTTLSEIRVTDSLMSFVYTAQPMRFFWSAVFQANVAREICTDPSLIAFLEEGVVIETIYNWPDLSEIGRLSFSVAECRDVPSL